MDNQTNNEWIDASKQSPTPNERVWVSDSKGHTKLGYKVDDKWFVSIGIIVNDPVHGKEALEYEETNDVIFWSKNVTS